MGMNKIPVLLAGINGYGAFYLDEILNSNDDSFFLAGVADPYAALSPRLAELKEQGVPVFKSPDEFYASGNRAALAIIASPIHTHYPYTISCLKHGSNVLCEKPVTGDLARFDDLIAREEESGLFVAVGFQLSFSRNVQLLKEDIMKGLFGKPLEFKALCLPRRSAKYYSRNNCVGKRIFEGETILDSPLNNACAHELHNMLFLLGDTMAVCARVESLEAELWQARPEIENYDAAALRLNTSGKVKVLFYTAHCVEEHAGPLGEYKFERAVIHFRKNDHVFFTANFNDGSTKMYDEKDKVKDMQKFYDALESVRTGIKPVCTLKTVRGHTECVTRAQEFPINKVTREKLNQGFDDDGDSFFYVPKLREAFLKSYEKGVLPSETGFTV